MFSKNRDRLLTTDIARTILAAILAHRDVAPLLSQEHVSVDGTLVKAWASMKGFQPKPEPAPPGEDRGPDDPPTPPPAADTCARPNPESAPMPPENPTDRNAEVDFVARSVPMRPMFR